MRPVTNFPSPFMFFRGIFFEFLITHEKQLLQHHFKNLRNVCKNFYLSIFFILFIVETWITGGTGCWTPAVRTCTCSPSPSSPTEPTQSGQHHAEREGREAICETQKYVYIKSSTVYFPSSELGLSQPLSSHAASVPLPLEPGGKEHTRVGWGGGGVSIPTNSEDSSYSLMQKYR
jgi:hypothetical protein